MGGRAKAGGERARPRSVSQQKRRIDPGIYSSTAGPARPCAARLTAHWCLSFGRALAAMRIVLLSRSSSSYTTRRLSDVARTRGHHVRILDPLRCELLLDGQNAQVLYRRKPLGHFDLVIPRIAQSITGYGLAVLAQLALRGAATVNDAAGVAQAHNKLRCLQALAARGIEVPRTVMAGERANLSELATLVGGVPVLVRLVSSGQRT